MKRQIIASLALVGVVSTALAQSIVPVEEEAIAWNARQEIAGQAKKTSLYGKIVNYVNDNGDWNTSDYNFVETNKGFQIVDAPYELVLPKKANRQARFLNKNRWDFKEQKIAGVGEIGLNRVFIDARPVNGEITKEGIVRYPNALPDINGDIVIEADNDQVRWLVEWQARPTICATQPSFKVRFWQNYDGNAKPRDGNGSEATTKKRNYEKFYVQKDSIRGISTPQAYIWDSNGYREEVTIEGQMQGVNFIGSKIINCSSFDDVIFPVRTDDTTTIYPDPNVETSSVDGFIQYTAEPWATCQGATAGDTANDSGVTVVAGSGLTGTSNRIWRAAMLFDTSAIADTDTVDSADLDMYFTSFSDGDNDAQAYVNIVSSNPASNTALATGDYDQVGDAIDDPTTFSSNLDIGSITTSAYNTFTLNASGISNIDVTGVSKFGMREGHDMEDDAYAGSAEDWSRAIASSADEAGTSQDPKLVVTHTAAAAAPAGPRKVIQVIISSLLPKAQAR